MKIKQNKSTRFNEYSEHDDCFHRTLEFMYLGCQIIGFDWRYLFVNDMAADHGRKTKEYLLGRTMMEAYPGIENTDLFDLLRQSMEERETYRRENLFTYPDGIQKWFDLLIMPVQEGILIQSIDISDYKKVEIELRDNEFFLQTLLTAMPLPVYYMDKEGRCLGINKAHETFFGIKQEHLLGKTLHHILPQDIARIDSLKDKELFETGKSLQYETQVQNSEGELCNVIINKAVFKDTQNAVKGSIGTILDITDRKRVEKKLRDNERILNNTGKIGKIGGWKHDLVTGKAVWTEALYNIIDIPCNQDPPGVQKHLEFYPPKDRSVLQQEYQRAIADGKPFDLELQVYTTKGTLIWCRVKGEPVYENGVCVALQGTFQDITDHILTQKRLEESQKTLETIYQSVNVGILIADAETRGFVDANRTMSRMLGYSIEELLNLTISDIHPKEELPRISVTFEAQLSGSIQMAENMPVKRKDGSVFAADINAVPLELAGRRCLLGVFRDITECKKAEMELAEYRTGLENLVEQRTTELNAAQMQLVQKEKLAALGKLTGGVSHELRNPLGAIKNAVYFLKMAITETDPEIMESIEIIANEINTAERIIGSMLDFARPRLPERERININQLLESTVEGCSIPSNVDVIRDLDPNIPLIMADAVQISRVFINLINNAVQAMPKGGELSITTFINAEEMVRITIGDSGIGISEENISMMFEPLFTTKSKGIGLGLAISKTYIERHGGDITVESIPGVGSTFAVILPVNTRDSNE